MNHLLCSPSASTGSNGPATPPSWWPKLEEMLKWEPHLDPLQQIPNRLFRDYDIVVSGREVKQAIEAFWVADPEVA